ncbi:general odorant-binding protein 19d [Scaptodrosophila lebanonensis]|uniref:General odorant-binding protein 19d n=1 Tax=Drosophila lebanonensis TaxID=7225 RepID=A0A6J2TYF1_DROLE|nr:general odorant-binding protein 19d [Scaptodrosophila lebanonensis]
MSRFTSLSLILLLGVSAICSVQCELTKEHAAEAAHECQAETGASDDDVSQLMKHEMAESHEAKCLRACVMKKIGIMDDSGKLDKDQAIAMVKAMSHDDAEKEAARIDIVEKCEAIETPEDHCEAASAYEACIHEHIHEHGLSLEEH